MAKRRLSARGGFAALSENLQGLLSMLMQNNMMDKRMDKQNNLLIQRQLLDDFNTGVKTLDSADVRARGPQAVRADYEGFKRRLPAGLHPIIGEDPDFQSMDSKPEERLAGLLKEFSGASSADDPRLAPGGLRRLAPAHRVDPTVDVPNLMTGLTPSGQEVDDPAFVEVEKLAQNMREGLLAKEGFTPVPDFSSGTRRDTFVPNRQLGQQGPVQAERTPGQEASRQGEITGATEQARVDVQNNPKNVAGFVSRTEAEAYARQIASLKADQRMGAGSFAPQPVIKDEMDAGGNVVYKVIDAKTGRLIGDVQGGQPMETVTGEMRTAYSYAERAIAAHNEMTKLEPEMMKRGYLGTLAQLKLDELNAPESISDPLIRQYANQTRAFINAGLGRPESGAQISQSEFEGYRKTNAFTPGTDEKTLGLVVNNRRLAAQGLATRAGTRLGQRFVTMADIQADAQDTGQSVEQAIQQAESEGFRVMY